MATPADLARAFADALIMPITSVAWHDRMLHEANLRTKAGRGRGSAQLTARDAAVLLTSILASPQPKEAAQTIALFVATRPDRQRSSKKFFAQAGLSELARLPADHSFIDALEALFLSGMSGDLAAWLAKHRATKRGRTPPQPLIDVATSTPGPVGDIRVAGILEGMTARVIYTIPERSMGAGRTATGAEQGHLSDLGRAFSITARTIIRVADVLAGREANDE